MTAGVPDVPLSGVGPAAASVQSAGVAVAPVVPLSTCLTSVSCGATAVLVIVHVTLPPEGTGTVLPVGVAPVHDQAEGGVAGRPARLGQRVGAGVDRARS